MNGWMPRPPEKRVRLGGRVRSQFPGVCARKYGVFRNAFVTLVGLSYQCQQR